MRSGGLTTLIHDQNAEDVLELVQRRKGIDTVSIALYPSGF